MSIIYVPYHLDDYLPDLHVPLPEGTDVAELAVELPNGHVWSRLGWLYESVAGAVERAVRAGSVPVIVSGDCTVSIGIAAGLQQAGVDPAAVWFDAHGDLQTLETTSSGYIGGMALRFLAGYRPELFTQPLGLRPLAEDQVMLVDARDLDPAEADYLASAQVKRSTVGELSEEVLPAGPLLVNLDLDIHDPADLPGLRYPASGGPDATAVLRAARTVLDTGRVGALHIACTWRDDDPDPDGTREHLVSALLTNLLGG